MNIKTHKTFKLLMTFTFISVCGEGAIKATPPQCPSPNQIASIVLDGVTALGQGRAVEFGPHRYTLTNKDPDSKRTDGIVYCKYTIGNTTVLTLQMHS